MKKLLLFILCSVVISAGAQSITRLLVVSNFDNTLRVLDTASYVQVASKTMTFSGGSFQGIHGLARKPSTGIYYGVVNDGAGTRYLATINPVTGSVVSLGSLGDNFSCLTFNGNSTLLGLTGSGATTASRVYRINTANAAKTSVATLNNVYGQVMAYNPSDNRIYHWTGGSSVTYNSYDTSFASSTTINIGASSSEVTAAVYKTGNIFITSDWDLNYRNVRAAGGSSVITYFGSNGYYPKGMAYITCSRSITPATPTVCANNTLTPITLTMSGTAGATYQWFKAGVAISGATLATLNTSTTGTGRYICRINDGCGQDTLAAAVIVSVAPLPTVAITGSTFACSGNSVVLTGSSGGTSQWYRNGVLIGGATANTYSASQSGRYNMIKTNLNGCADSSATGLTITIAPTPTIGVSNGNICPGGSYTFVPNGASTYSITGGSFVVSPIVTTTYAISGTSSLGCVGNAVGTVSIQASLNVAITGNTAACIGNSVVLTAGGAASYTWNTGAVSNTIAVSPTTQSTYSCIGASGTCSNTATYTLAVNPRPTISAVASSSVICAGGTTTLTASGANTYTWTGGPVNGASFAPTTTNSYSVTGTNTLTGCTNTNITAITITVNPLPVVTASASSPVICNGFSTTLSGGGASTYTWTGNATNLVAFAPSVTATYSVTGTSAAGCASSNTATVLVTVNPLPTITVNSGTICSGYVFTMNPSGASSYTFSSGSNTLSAVTSTNINISGTSALGCTSTVSATSSITVNASPTITAAGGTVCVGKSFSISPVGANTYSFNGAANSTGTVSPAVTTTYSVTGTGTNNCITPTPVVVTVSVIANPTVTALATPTGICMGQANAVLTGSGASTYTWNTSAQTASISVSPTAAAVYTVSGANAFGCVVSSTVSVWVYSLPGVSISAPVSFVCPGASATLTANGAVNYSWSNTNTGSVTVVNPTITTTYTVTGADLLGCTNTQTVAITVNTLNITVSPNSSICLGSATTLSANGAVSYTWSNGGLFQSIPVSPTVLTTYTVSGTDINNCNHTATISVGVNNNPTITISTSSAAICVNETATITAIGAATYSWNSGQTSSVIIVTPTLNLTQNYFVTGVDANSCTASASASLGVSLCTGISEFSAELAGLTIFPNPSNGEFIIKANQNITLLLINELGQQIKTLSLNESNAHSVTVNSLSAGIYFLTSTNATQAIRQKIIVNN